MIMLFSMTTMPWPCYISWWPCHDLAMILPWRVWMAMIIPYHSIIVMFDHGCRAWLHVMYQSISNSQCRIRYLKNALKGNAHLFVYPCTLKWRVKKVCQKTNWRASELSALTDCCGMLEKSNHTTQLLGRI